jgi:YVTN family beta-propeller protein
MVTALMLSHGLANAQCPAFGADTTCGTIITLTNTGATVTTTGQPPYDTYDGIIGDDTLVGVVNNSNTPITSLGLSSSLDIFGFDGDGIDTYGAPGNALDNTGYGGPNAYFTNISQDATTGTVNFIVPIATGGGTAYFSLENQVSSVSVGVNPGVTPGPFAYVANLNSNNVSVINIPASYVANTIPVGSGPWGVAVSPDQTQVYVSNSQGNNVSVINTASSSVVATIPVQSSPFGVAFTPDGTAAYVANAASNSVSVINTTSQTVVATVPVQDNPVGVAMALTSNGTFAYVTNDASNSVSVIAVASNTVVQTIPVGSGPQWVAVSPNSKWAYVENAGSNSVSVISVATNTVTATIPVGTNPVGAAFTPDSSLAYIVNLGSMTVSVIDTASASVVATVAGFNYPFQVALTADGASAYVTDQSTNNVSVIATASNTITGTVGVGSQPIGVAIASAPPTELPITMQLNETGPTQFNFGPHNFTVQYPPGTTFPPVNMTVVAAQTTQASYRQAVAGTQFANSVCIVYSGAGGNCVNYQVTCSDMNGNPVTCPSEPTPSISVKTSYDTQQAIINPGFLTAPIGSNQFQNIFSEFFLQRIDPTTKGFTKGFSQFYAVDLGAGNAQGAGNFAFLAPLLPTDPRVFDAGVEVPVEFQLTSITNPTQPITDAVASLTVVMVSDVYGIPESKVVLAKKNAFQYQGGGDYLYQMNTAGFGDGTYVLTVYGNAFAAQQVQFTIQSRAATTCVISASTQFFYNGEPITFTGTMQPKHGTGTPTGTATFFLTAKSQIELGTVSLVGGSASITAALQAPPNRQFVKVEYSGDNNFKGCESPYITENYSPSE